MVSITGDQIVAKAREYIGTRWTHKGRVKGVGVDCVGLLVGVFSELGLEVVDNLEYSSGDEIELLNSCLAKHGVKREGEAREGDVIVFRNTLSVGSQPMLNHVGIMTGEGSFIHSWSTPSAMRVVETPLDDFWSKWIVATYGIS